MPDGEHADLLARRWADLHRGAGTPEARESVLRQLFEAYEGPGRHYHNLRHVARMLDEFDTVRAVCGNEGPVEAAVWFHDAVYDPRRNDNEERSAELAEASLRRVDTGREFICLVREMIVATKHTERPRHADARLLVDLDLAILGRPTAEFEAYERAICQEYAHVEEKAFRAGRAAILRKLLGRPRIYFTDVLRDRYEARARENLARSIAALETPGV